MTQTSQLFFELVRAGLWGTEGHISALNDAEMEKIVQLAEEQVVEGLVLEGIERLMNNRDGDRINIPLEQKLQLIGDVQIIEHENVEMNRFVAQLFKKLQDAGIDALLVKGQGIAQCYKKPLWRVSGDVDLFLDKDNYQKAADCLSTQASSVDEENLDNLHLGMIIANWTVELHGTLRSGLWGSVDRVIDDLQAETFERHEVRKWENGDVDVPLPAENIDVVFVFSHILQHFYKEGVGLRQVCDWCRLLWTYRDTIDVALLESRLRMMRVMTEWKVFAGLAVEYLGMPVEAMPLYSADKRWKKKAARVMDFVLETGSFGHNRDYSYYKKYPKLVFKAISLWRHCKDFVKYLRIFPLDSLKVWFGMIGLGIKTMIRGK